MAQIAVIIPTFDRPKLLREAIDSLLAQTFEDWEAAIIEGSPTASPPDISDPRIKYFREQDFEVSGLAAARNLGVQQTDSSYIAYLDDDEYYYPTKLEVMHRFLQVEATGEFAYHDIVVSVVHWSENTLQRLCVPRPHWHPKGDPNHEIQKQPFIAGLQVLHARQLFEQVGGFRENKSRGIFGGQYRNSDDHYDEDSDLWQRLAALTTIERVPLQLGEYRVHGANVNSWGIDYEEVVRTGRLEKPCY